MQKLVLWVGLAVTLVNVILLSVSVNNSWRKLDPLKCGDNTDVNKLGSLSLTRNLDAAVLALTLLLTVGTIGGLVAEYRPAHKKVA